MAWMVRPAVSSPLMVNVSIPGLTATISLDQAPFESAVVVPMTFEFCVIEIYAPGLE